MITLNSMAPWFKYRLQPKQTATPDMLPWRDQYAILSAYYYNNGLYDNLRLALLSQGASVEALKPLRNPAYRVIEFYAAKLYPGTLPEALPIVTDNEKIIEPIQQIWRWSNWSTNKQAAARMFATTGDQFIKVALKRSASGEPQSVHFQNIKAEHVTEIDSDERGYLTYIRIDVPRKDKERNETKMYTEVWDKSTQTLSLWQHSRTPETPIKELGAPTETRLFSEFGIDFIPVVWEQFRSVGADRGMAAISPALDKIDEANRQATRLHQMLFRYNKPIWAAVSIGTDANGRPLPPPKIGTASGDMELSTNTDDDILKLPGQSSLSALVPTIDYSAALEIVRDQMTEIRSDLPEMVYSDISTGGSDLSAVAIRYLLEAATSRLLEARGNAESALQRANAMALTIGQNVGLFNSLGDYTGGAFDHSFAERPVLEMSEFERATLFSTYTSAGVPPKITAKRAGWRDAEADELDTAMGQQEMRDQAAMDAAATLTQLRQRANQETELSLNGQLR